MRTAFLTMIQNLEAKEKMGKFDYVKIKKFMHVRNTVSRVKRQMTN